MMKKKVVIILGPTTSGKTELALKIAKKFCGYIISADSRQIYKDMNIGTAKPKGKIQNVKSVIKEIESVYIVKNIPHFLMHYVKPDQTFSLANWLKISKKLLNSKIINSKYKLPIICGGTGLYISALVNNYQLPKGKINLNLRNKLNKLSLNKLSTKLKKLDIETYNLIDKKNKRKIVRALEYILTNNKKFKPKQKVLHSPYEFLQIGLDIPREQLYKRIDQRVEKMIKSGLIEETKQLTKKYSTNLPAMSSIGYRQINMYLQGVLNKAATIELIKRDTRHYAKRQLTWFRRNKNIKWINNYSTAEKLVNNFLQN